MELIREMAPISFTSAFDDDQDFGTQHGFSAERVASVHPQWVSRNEDGDPQGLDTTAILANVVAALQDLDERLQGLEAQ
jgi:hypothetical protein